MTNFDKTWEDFSQMLKSSNLKEGQKHWLLLKLQSILTKEIDCADNTILSINEKLSKNMGITTKPDERIKAEKEVAKAYRNAYAPIQDLLSRNCKEIIDSYNKLTPTEKNDLKESIDSPYQCDNPNTRKKIRKTLCGFRNSKRPKNEE